MPRRIKTSLATKFALTFATLFVVTMFVIMYGVRQVVTGQFTREYEREVAKSTDAVRLELESRHKKLVEQLREFGKKLARDHDFRLHAFVLEDVHNPFLIDYAGKDMSAMGLQVLEIANESGLVLSSGHARNTFGKRIRSFIRRLQSGDSTCTLAWFDQLDRDLLCLTAVEHLSLGDAGLYVLGGIEITPSFLEDLQDDSTNLALVQLPKSAIVSSPHKVKEILSSYSFADNPSQSLREFEQQYSIGEFALPVVEKNSTGQATVYLLHPRTQLTDLLENLNRRVLLITAIGMISAIFLAIWLTRSVARPLQRLATAANDLSFERLQAKFEVNGDDEVGVLSEAFSGMIKRLRLSRMKLALAERKAAFAELAHQVNHDIKNGFVPIRKVMEYWQEVAQKEPENLVATFHDRQPTITKSLDYLEGLARGYSRLRTPMKLTSVSVNQIVRDLLQDYQGVSNDHIRFETHLDTTEPKILADEVQLRRAFENVLQNAIDAIEQSGKISITSRVAGEEIQLIWEDTGKGIPEEIREQLFKPHVTTKEDGTGLGLANVRRIVGDFKGTVTIQSETNQGTTVSIMLPKAN